MLNTQMSSRLDTDDAIHEQRVIYKGGCQAQYGKQAAYLPLPNYLNRLKYLKAK